MDRNQLSNLVRLHVIEPLNFFGIPSILWASALLTLTESIELLLDNDMYNFFEERIRSGLTFVNKYHVVASEDTVLIYIDIKNLYGWALSHSLPRGNFRLEHDDEDLTNILQECMNSDLESLSYGYIIKVDMEIPDEIHDILNDLPVEAEKMYPSGSKVEKLMLTHYPKYNYVMHWRLLKIYLSLGVKVINMHRAVKFKQVPIFNNYVDNNTKLRTNSKRAGKELLQTFKQQFG